jgi:hypothetical protein
MNLGKSGFLAAIIVIREQLREKHERPTPESPNMGYNTSD